MQVKNGDVILHVETAGDQTASPLLLMHGITVSGRTWDWFVPTLAARFRVLTLDFRGHGKSGWAPGDYQPQAFVTDAIAVLEELADGPAIVIGHSLGGTTGAALMQQRPDLVKAAVLEDPPLGAMDGASALHGNPLLDAFRLMRATVPGLQEACVPVERIAETMATMPSSSGAPFGDLIQPDAINVMAQALLELDVTVLDPILDGTALNSFDRTKPIELPTLILSADPAMPDALATPLEVDPVLETSPSVEHKAIPGSGHLVHDGLATREGFVDQVEEFLAKF
jgi:pimeloyl-ACP methyl ester carboxylesterase